MGVGAVALEGGVLSRNLKAFLAWALTFCFARVYWLNPTPLTMKVPGTVSQILKSKAASSVWSISPDSSVYEAVRMMDFKNIGALPVIEDGRVVGMLSERDYTRKIILRGKSSKDTAVREIMSAPAVTVSPQHAIDECLRLMTGQRVRHLPVLDGERIVGIVSIGDLVNWVISAQSATIDNLEGYISGRYPG